MLGERCRMEGARTLREHRWRRRRTDGGGAARPRRLNEPHDSHPSRPNATQHLPSHTPYHHMSPQSTPNPTPNPTHSNKAKITGTTALLSMLERVQTRTMNAYTGAKINRKVISNCSHNRSPGDLGPALRIILKMMCNAIPCFPGKRF